jgi:hypothetical protein
MKMEYCRNDNGHGKTEVFTENSMHEPLKAEVTLHVKYLLLL